MAQFSFLREFGHTVQSWMLAPFGGQGHFLALGSVSDADISSSPVFWLSQLLCSPCGHDPLDGILHPSCFVMEASLGIQMDEPMACSPLCDRFQEEGSFKNHEQNFKLPGMCWCTGSNSAISIIKKKTKLPVSSSELLVYIGAFYKSEKLPGI